MRAESKKLTHTGTVTLTSDRLILRKIESSDCEAIHNALAADPAIIDGIGWDENPTMESTKRNLEKIIEKYDRTESPAYYWLIVEAKSGDVAGMIFLDSYAQPRRTAEVDYCIVHPHRGKGYAPEALRLVIDHLFDAVGFHRVEAVYNLYNNASGRVLEKAGMRFEGILRGRALRIGEDGYPEDLKLCAILATDRRNRRNE